jgi:hypothetical protein
VVIERLTQCLRLHDIGVQLGTMTDRPNAARHTVTVDMHDQVEAELYGATVAERDHVAELPGGIDVQQRKWQSMPKLVVNTIRPVTVLRSSASRCVRSSSGSAASAVDCRSSTAETLFGRILVVIKGAPVPVTGTNTKGTTDSRATSTSERNCGTHFLAAGLRYPARGFPA